MLECTSKHLILSAKMLTSTSACPMSGSNTHTHTRTHAHTHAHTQTLSQCPSSPAPVVFVALLHSVTVVS